MKEKHIKEGMNIYKSTNKQSNINDHTRPQIKQDQMLWMTNSLHEIQLKSGAAKHWHLKCLFASTC